MANNSIALGIQPVQNVDPGQVQSNAIARLSALTALRDKQIADAQTKAQKSLYQDAPGTNPGDPGSVFNPDGSVNAVAIQTKAAKSGQGYLVPALQTQNTKLATDAAGLDAASLKNIADTHTQFLQGLVAQSPQTIQAYADSWSKQVPGMAPTIRREMANAPLNDPDAFAAWKSKAIQSGLTAQQQLEKHMQTVDTGQAQVMVSTNANGDPNPQVVGTFQKGVSPDVQYQTDHAVGQTFQTTDAQGVAHTFLMRPNGTIGEVKSNAAGDVEVGSTPVGAAAAGGGPGGGGRVMGWTPRGPGTGNSNASVDNKVSLVAHQAGATPDAPLTKDQFLALNMTALEGTPAGKNNFGNMKNTDGSFKSFDTPQAYQAAQTAWLERRWNEGARTVRDAVEGRVAGGTQTASATPGSDGFKPVGGAADKNAAPKVNAAQDAKDQAAMAAADEMHQLTDRMRANLKKLHDGGWGGVASKDGSTVNNILAQVGRIPGMGAVKTVMNPDMAQAQQELENDSIRLFNLGRTAQQIPAAELRGQQMDMRQLNNAYNPGQLYESQLANLDAYNGIADTVKKGITARRKSETASTTPAAPAAKTTTASNDTAALLAKYGIH